MPPIFVAPPLLSLFAFCEISLRAIFILQNEIFDMPICLRKRVSKLTLHSLCFEKGAVRQENTSFLNGQSGLLLALANLLTNRRLRVNVFAADYTEYC